MFFLCCFFILGSENLAMNFFSPPLTLRFRKNAERDPLTLFAHGLSATGNDLPQTSPQKYDSSRKSQM